MCVDGDNDEEIEEDRDIGCDADDNDDEFDDTGIVDAAIDADDRVDEDGDDIGGGDKCERNSSTSRDAANCAMIWRAVEYEPNEACATNAAANSNTLRFGTMC